MEALTERARLDPGHAAEGGPVNGVVLERYSEPFQRALELIGKRWTGAVIRYMLHGPVRFNQLLMGIPGISDRVLTERLRELEAEGLAERLVDAGPPVRVTYRLTAHARRLASVFEEVDAWAGVGE